MAIGLHHVELYVSDLKRSMTFWHWFLQELGYEKWDEWDKGESWKVNDTYIVFVQTEEKFLNRPPYHRSAVGLNHLAFWADSKVKVDDMVTQAQQLGWTLLYKDHHPYAGGPDYYAAYFEDPDRIKVELVAPEGSK